MHDFQDYGHIRHPYREFVEKEGTPLVPYVTAEIGRSDNCIDRHYRLTRLDRANVMRSLGGAVKRDRCGWVSLCFETRSARLPDEFDQLEIPGGGSVIEACSRGRLNGDFLMMKCSGWTSEDEKFTADVEIRLSEIVPPVIVSYQAPAMPVVQVCKCPWCGKMFKQNFGYEIADEGESSSSDAAELWAITCQDCFEKADRLHGDDFMGGLWEAGELELAEWLCGAAAAVPAGVCPMTRQKAAV